MILSLRSWIANERVRESGVPQPVRRLASLFPPARCNHAAAGVCFGPSLPLDRQYVELLVARFGHLAHRDRIPLLGRPRLFVETAMGALDRSGGRAIVWLARPAARLDVRRPDRGLPRPVRDVADRTRWGA